MMFTGIEEAEPTIYRGTGVKRRKQPWVWSVITVVVLAGGACVLAWTAARVIGFALAAAHGWRP